MAIKVQDLREDKEKALLSYTKHKRQVKEKSFSSFSKEYILINPFWIVEIKDVQCKGVDLSFQPTSSFNLMAQIHDLWVYVRGISTILPYIQF